MQDYQKLPPHSRVWVYQCNRAFTAEETANIQQQATLFVNSWSSHGDQLSAAISIFYHRFVVVFVDEVQAKASGCSIDKSVALMKEIEGTYQVNLFDRMQVAYRDENDDITSCSLQNFESLLDQGIINENTIVFNNLVATKNDFENDWETPLKNSWHQQLLAKQAH